MNIPRINPDGYVPPATAKAPPAKGSPAPAASEVFRPEQNQKLLSKINSEPDVRPEAVERARALITSAKYPSATALREVARQILQQAFR
jgi:hypothetical protein